MSECPKTLGEKNTKPAKIIVRFLSFLSFLSLVDFRFPYDYEIVGIDMKVSELIWESEIH